MGGTRRLLSLLVPRKPSRAGFLDLPYELRLQIYQYSFADCYIRYHQDSRGLHIHVKRDRCQGPAEHNLLATCRQVYNEGRDFLLEHPPYVIIDDVDAGQALYRMNTMMKSPLLQVLIASTHRLVLSKPAETLRHFPELGSIPKFTNLKEVEIFGFYPDLRVWLYRNRTIAMGWASFRWKLGWWRSTRRLTNTRRIHLGDAARWVHDITETHANNLAVHLRAWTFDVDPGHTKWIDLTVSR